MSTMHQQAKTGRYMLSEIAEAPSVFSRAVLQNTGLPEAVQDARAFYTVARGSSDAAANILSYEFMRELEKPMTSLPPSVFSLGNGVCLEDAGVIVVSQSGASDDLVATARKAGRCGAAVIAITNAPGSLVESVADARVAIDAGPEIAVPATKTVIGSIAAGMALLAGLKPAYGKACKTAANAFAALHPKDRHPRFGELVGALARAENVYVIGRGAGYGAAHEVALKLKETCALHAEAYSASEVLHGPLQLVNKPLTVILLDTADETAQESLNTAEARFSTSGAKVIRLASKDMVHGDLPQAAAAAMLLYACYPAILDVALALGLNPDTPNHLSKVTRTV